MPFLIIIKYIPLDLMVLKQILAPCTQFTWWCIPLCSRDLMSHLEEGGTRAR